MRHGKKDNHLGRTASHRSAMLSNMASSLILHKRIETTLAKAKELKKYVEPLLTRSKEDNTHNRRIIFSYLPNKEVIKELFSTVSDKIADRPGGYTRIIKLGSRQGDAAEVCVIELVDFNETLLAATAEKVTKTRRSRRGGKKSGESTASAAAFADAEVVETIAVEAPALEEVVEEAAAPVIEAAPAADEAPATDDIEIIEGIGPKIAEALAAAGVTTFAQLADMTPEAIQEIVSEAGIGSKSPATWPQQAALARDGKFDELKAWQDELNAGQE
ncbi:MAG: 50S ribosomal protein L17 [Spirosomaceae bacterium]|jgi:large subunit ribosomal protein L17|nr:50S ribosomal protein L17 [Spirosomataceae bacterium]